MASSKAMGDTTFRGNQSITRYEMAQMVAKAMAKTDVSAADKALIDKLAAEFSDELNNLGVRVSNLERNADMVKWNGLVEYTYTSTRHDAGTTDKERKLNDNDLTFRLEPKAEVNKNWDVHARLDADTKLDSDKGGLYDGKVELKRVWLKVTMTTLMSNSASCRMPSTCSPRRMTRTPALL